MQERNPGEVSGFRDVRLRAAGVRGCLGVLLLLGGRLVPGQVATEHAVLVKNLQRFYVEGGPRDPHRLGNMAVFAAFTPGSGWEWWKADPNRRLGASRIRDIAPGSAGGLDPNRISAVEMAGVLYFAANDRVHGRELWRTDGSEAGTVLVKDLVDGPPGSQPGEFVVWNGRLFGTGIEEPWFKAGVWTSDGTGVGTRWVRQVQNGGPSRPVAANGAVWFTVSGWEDSALWKTDGTTAGTVQVSVIRGEFIQTWSLTEANGRLYFFGRPPLGSDAGSLWTSDGTAAGTKRIQQRIPGANGDTSTSFGTGGHFYFETTSPARQLWRTDGTPGGAGPVGPAALGEVFRVGTTWYLAGVAADRTGTELWSLDTARGAWVRLQGFQTVPGQFVLPSSPLGLGGTLLFQGTDTEAGTELWRSDGTPQGTRRLGDLVPGSGSSFARPLGVAGGVALVGTRDADFGVSLWRSDGTEAGTSRLRVLRAGRPGTYSWVAPFGGPDSTGPLLLSVQSERLSDASEPLPEPGPIELWATDGTSEGTRWVTSFGQHPGNAATPLIQVGKVTLFTVPAEAGGYRIWRTDGTREGTFLVRDAHVEQDYGSGPSALLASRGRLYFFARDDTDLTQLWSSDGSAEGTDIVHRWVSGDPGAWNPQDLVDVAGTLFFVRSSSNSGTNVLWKSDGTQAGTQPVATWSSRIDGLTAVGGRLFFQEGEGNLWVSDGTASGTRELRRFDRLWRGPELGMRSGLAANGGRVFFVVSTRDLGTELWVSDGTEAGTRRVQSLAPGTPGSELRRVAAVGERLFFARTEGMESWSLWVTDGTDAGTTRLRRFEQNPTTGSSWVEFLGRLFFSASDADGGEELWTSDGTVGGTVRLRDIGTGAEGSYPRRMTISGRTLYFWAYQGEGQDLWKTDGTEAGTVRVKANTPWSSPYDEVTAVAGNTLYFHGPVGLWRSDGTEAGTGPVPNPGGMTLRVPFAEGFSPPQSLAAVGGTVFFVADDGVSGFELWKFGESDADGDGLPDVWEQRYFGGHATPDADPDGDGMTNGAEVRAGTDPTRADSNLEVRMVRDEDAGIVRIEWSSTPGQEYVLLRSRDPGAIGAEVERRIPATPPRNVFRDALQPGAGPVLYRVQVEP